MKKFLIVVITLVALFFVIRLISIKYYSAPAEVSSPIISEGGSATVQASPLTYCGLTINSPIRNQTVTFPLTINGLINNTNIPEGACSWQMFEGQAGTAQLLFQDSNQVWQPINKVPIPVSDWTNPGPDLFSFSIDFDNSSLKLPSGTLLQVIFTPENASGKPSTTALELPLVLQ